MQDKQAKLTTAKWNISDKHTKMLEKICGETGEKPDEALERVLLEKISTLTPIPILE